MSLKQVGSGIGRIASTFKSNRFSVGEAAAACLNAATMPKLEKRALSVLVNNKGLLTGNALANALTGELAKALNKPAERVRAATFAEWTALGCLPLRVVASDLATRTAVILDDQRTPSTPVIDAVVASASFPFAFQARRPRVETHPHAVLVDGGLASNSPSFLFAEEYRVARTPTLVFQFAPASPEVNFPRNIDEFARAVVDTAVNASDAIIDSMLPHTHIITIDGANNTGLFKELDRDEMNHLFACGQSVLGKLHNLAPLRRPGHHPAETTEIGLRFGNPPPFNLTLRAARREIYLGMKKHRGGTAIPGLRDANDLRAALFVPSMPDAREWRIAFHVGFRGDRDVAITLEAGRGCVGTAVVERNLVIDDLLDRSTVDPPATETSLVPADRRGVIACPVFEHSPDGARRGEQQVIAVLAIDTRLSPEEAGWIDPVGKEMLIYVRDCMVGWSAVYARLLAT
jgi:hypothetical protein